MKRNSEDNSNSWKWIAAILLLAFWLSGLLPVFAQVQETQNTLSVRVFDSSGAPMASVPLDALSLALDGKKATLNEIGSLDHHQYLLLFDLSFSSVDGILAARQGAWKFLSLLQKQDVAALAVYDNRSFVRVLCGFSSDRRQWLSALNHMERKTEDLDPNGLYFSEDARQPGEDHLVEDVAMQAILSPYLTPLSKDKVAAAAEQFTNRLSEFARMLVTVRGEKQVLLFSPGAPVKKGSSDVVEPESSMDVDTEGGAEATELGQSGGRPKDPVQALGDTLAASNCVVYSFDLSAIGKPGGSNKNFLKTLAKRSRGAYYENLAGLDQIKAASAVQVLLGWRSTGAQQQSQDVKVSVSGGMKVSAPSNVFTSKALTDLNPLEKKLYLGQWLYQQSDSEAFQHREFVDSFPIEPGLSKTVFFLQLPGQQILDLKTKSRSYYIGGAVLDVDGRIFDSILTPVRVNTDKTFDKLKNAGLKYYDVLLTPPGDYHFRGYVIDVEGIKVAGVSFPFHVPDFLGLAMTRPVIACANNDWIEVRHEYRDETKRGIKIEYPYDTGTSVFFPELTPQLQNGSTVFVYYMIHNLALDASNNPDPHIRFALNPTSGQPTDLPDWKTFMKVPRENNSFGLLYQINIGTIAPGNYQLEADFGDGIAKKVVTRNVSVQVK
jgi:hypothetical protein